MTIFNDPETHDPSEHHHRQALLESQANFPTFIQSGIGGPTRFPKKYGPEVYTQAIVIHDTAVERIGREITKLRNEMVELKEEVNQILVKKPAIVSSKIHSLPSEKYELLAPIDVILEIYSDEALAVIPELELYGEGKTEMDAISDLKLELIDLYENVVDMADDELGDSPREWKKILQQLVVKCQ